MQGASYGTYLIITLAMGDPAVLEELAWLWIDIARDGCTV